MKFFILLFATGFGVGCIPWTPGTAGSLLGLLLVYLLSCVPNPLSFLILACFVLFSVLISDHAEKLYQEKDASKIVIDEICGMAVSLVGMPWEIQVVVPAFIFFRLFDVVKIPPARWIEKECRGGWGIVLDDLVAGVYVRGILMLILYFGWL